MTGALGAPADAGGAMSSALRGFHLDLASGAGLHVMPAPAQLAENARLLYLALERLERPVEAVGLVEVNFGHRSRDSGERDVAKRDEPALVFIPQR